MKSNGLSAGAFGNLLRLYAVVVIVLGVSGCAAGTKVGDFVSAVTTTIANPVSATNLYQAKVAFAGSQELVIKYQEDCFGSQLPPYPVTLARIRADSVLAVQCKHRVSRYNAMKAAEDKANAFILAADDFITRNPSGNAVSYVSAAVKAVNAYRATVGG